MCGTNPYGSTMPEWLAVNLETKIQVFVVQLSKIADMGLTKNGCLSSVLRLTCTYPTCTNDGRLQGYLTRERCESLFKRWYYIGNNN